MLKVPQTVPTFRNVTFMRNTVKRSGINGGARHKPRRQCRRQFRPFETLFVFVTQLNGREIKSNLIIPDYSDRYLIVLV